MSGEERFSGIVRLVPTKIRPPAVGDSIRCRGRIVEALDSGSELTLVVAPAGYGKTVAVAQWASGLDVPVAWLSVDAHDRPSERLWRYVVGALGTAVATLGAETAQSLDEWGPQGFDIVSTLLAELGEHREDMVLVLDDVHLIDPSILDELAFFLERSPAWLRTVLISRSDPGLPIGRWRVQGRVSEIRQRALSLTADEAREIVRGFEGVVLSDADTDFLVERTEGWAAALQVAGLSLRDRDDASTFLHDVLGTERMLFDYVVAEVLDRLPVDERNAVLVLSLLDDIDARRVTAMTRDADGETLLRRLESRGLPLMPLDAEQHTVRFHQLFRDLVVNELKLRRANELASLHRRAATAEQAAGDVPAAVRHHLAAGDPDAAFELVVTPVWDLYRNGRTREAAVWLEQFPEAFVAADPARMLSYAMVLSLVGRTEEASRWNDRAAPLTASDPHLIAELTISRMLIHLGGAETGAVLAEYDVLEAGGAAGTIERDPTVRVITMMALAALLDEDLDAASSWLTAIDRSPALPERARNVGLPARQAWLALERGLLGDADALSDASLRSAGRELHGAGHALVEAFAVRARLAAERADTDEADACAEQAVDLAADMGDPIHQAIAREALASALEARGGAAEALLVLEHLPVASPPGTALRTRHELLLAELEARSGRSDEAAERISGLAPSRRRTLVNLRIAADQGRVPDLADALAVDHTWPLGRQIEAELLHHRAQPGQAIHLRRALELGIAAGFVSTFLREGAAIAADLRRTVWGNAKWRSYPLAAALREPAETVRRDDHPLVETLSEKETQILQLLPTHLSAIEIAKHTFVSANTVRTHIKAIYRKLEVNSRSAAVQRATTMGLVTDEP